MTEEQLKEDVDRACDVLRRGGVILYPTDTVWGIGCDATNPEAVRRVYEIKQRDDSKALVILVGDRNDLWRYVDDVPAIAEELLDVSVRPTTIIYDRAINLAPNAVAADGSVAVRVTNEKVSRMLCRRFRKALVSTSANISGKPAPSTFAAIPDEIKKSVDYVMQTRRDDTRPALPSIIMKISSDSTFKIIRK